MDKFTSKQFHMTNRKPTSTLTQEWIKTGHNTKFSIDGEEGFQPDSLKTTYCSARELMEWLGQKVYEEDYIQDELGQIYEWDKHVINLNNIRVFYLCEGGSAQAI